MRIAPALTLLLLSNDDSRGQVGLSESQSARVPTTRRFESIRTLLVLMLLACGQSTAVPRETLPPPMPKTAEPAPTHNAIDRYLKYEAMESPEVLDWVTAQNDRTRQVLDGFPSRAGFAQDVAKYIQTISLGVPTKTKRGYLYSKKIPGQNQPLLVATKTIGKAEEIVLDPNGWSDDGSISLSNWALSRDERFLAFGITEGGSDWRTWRIFDLKTRKILADELRGLKWSKPSWAPGDRGLFYSGYPDRSHSESAKGTGNRIYYHALSTKQESDAEVFVPENEKWMASVDIHEAGDIAEIYLYKSSDGRQRIQLYGISQDWTKDPKSIFSTSTPHVLSPNFAWRQWVVGSAKGVVWLFSEENAPLGRIDRYNLETGKKETVVPPREATLVSVDKVGPYLFAKYLEDVKSSVVVYDSNGKEVDRIELPFPADIWGFSGGRSWHDEALFQAAGYATPPRIYRYRFKSKKEEQVWALPIDFDSDQFVSKQVFYSTKDGTPIPLFIVHSKSLKLDGQSPTILNGYGCYGVVSSIHFSSSRIAWLKRGGVYAVANIRGGGEYGEAWHLAGKRKNKQTSIDDFVAAAEWLHENKYTSPSTLTIDGVSCGGLLVGAAATQRPDLFAGAIAEVGILDLLRYHRFSGAYLWEEELGSPDSPDERSHLEKLSPLLAVQTKRDYPAMLITTRRKDTRVAPMNSYKFAAALQDHQSGKAPILLRVDESGGHALSALPLPKQIDYVADIYAFAWNAAKPKE